MEWLLANWQTVAAVLAAMWVLRAGQRAWRRRKGHGANLRVTVYCKHCNWEGVTRFGDPTCGGCGSHDVKVYAG